MTAPLSPSALKRLQKREQAQRRQSVKMGCKAILIDVEALWEQQEGLCVCDEVRYPGCRRAPLNPDVPGTHPDGIVIAHTESRAGRQHGDHLPGRVKLWRSACNAAFAGQEKRDAAVGDKLLIDMGLKIQPDPFLEEKPKRKWRWPIGRKIEGRGFQEKPANYISPLSKAARREAMEKVK